tara:strand:+ start:10539 stop:11297 length:759 start_codon:yes stop_codon:yes gene_type:complete
MSTKLLFVKRIKTEKNSIFYSLIKYNNEIIGFGRKHWDPKEKKIKIVKFNKELDIQQDNVEFLEGEDPRCFEFNDKIYVLNNYWSKMTLIDYKTKKEIKINISGKNISFINHNNKLYFIHYIKPFALYSFDIETGEIIKQDVNDDKNTYNYEYRGGTPGYKLDDNTYYGFGHRTYSGKMGLTHDIFKWIVYFDKELPRISFFDIDQPENSQRICDPTCVIEIDNKKYMVTAETHNQWFSDQDYITNLYEIVE